MTVAVRYLSKTGNTKKLAKAIGEAVGAQEEDLLSPIREPVEILFLGSAVYAAGIDEKVKKYLEENREQIGAIAAFSTAALICNWRSLLWNRNTIARESSDRCTTADPIRKTARMQHSGRGRFWKCMINGVLWKTYWNEK